MNLLVACETTGRSDTRTTCAWSRGGCLADVSPACASLPPRHAFRTHGLKGGWAVSCERFKVGRESHRAARPSRCAMSRPRGTHGLRTTHVTLEPSLEPPKLRQCRKVTRRRRQRQRRGMGRGTKSPCAAHRLPFPILPRRGDSRQRQNSRVGYHSGRWGSSAACAEGNLRPQRQRNLPSRGITAPNYPKPGLSPCRKALISS